MNRLVRVKFLLVTFFCLNIIDAASTHVLITLGVASEANLLMALAITYGWGMFWAIKLLVPSWLIMKHWNYVRTEILFYSLILINFAYGAVAIYHACLWWILI